jgi:hypothetical protein
LQEGQGLHGIGFRCLQSQDTFVLGRSATLGSGGRHAAHCQWPHASGNPRLAPEHAASSCDSAWRIVRLGIPEFPPCYRLLGRESGICPHLCLLLLQCTTGVTLSKLNCDFVSPSRGCEGMMRWPQLGCCSCASASAGLGACWCVAESAFAFAGASTRCSWSSWQMWCRCPRAWSLRWACRRRLGHSPSPGCRPRRRRATLGSQRQLSPTLPPSKPPAKRRWGAPWQFLRQANTLFET